MINMYILNIQLINTLIYMQIDISFVLGSTTL